MKPRCDPVNDVAESLENQKACHDASVRIIEQLGPVIEIRHKIGEAMMTPEGRKRIPAMEMGLSEAAKPILDTYAKEEENCRKTDNTESCIYAEQFRSFIKFFGPVVPKISGAKYSPVSIEKAYLKNGYLVVQVEPKSLGYEVLLDTGANRTTLSTEMVGLFKENIKVLSRTEYGKGSPYISFKGMSFNLGGIRFEPTFGMASPLVDYLEGSDRQHKLVAILGADFLFQRSWEVDYDKSHIVLDQDVEKELLRKEKWGRIPLSPVPYYLSYYIGIEVFINGRVFHLAFDTGAENLPIIEQCPLAEAKTSKRLSMVSVEGEHETKNLIDVPVKFGTNALRENIAVIPKESVNAKGLHEAGLCGFLGTNVLGRYNYIFDPKTLSLYIRPRREKDMPKSQSIGIVPKRTTFKGGEKVFVVAEITPDSLAEKAGLKQGDIIVELDGIKPDSMSMLEFVEIKYSAKPEVSVTIVRDGETKKLTLRFER